MDMYQKRKIRAEKKLKSENEKCFPKVSISWEDTTLGKPLLNLYK